MIPGGWRGTPYNVNEYNQRKAEGIVIMSAVIWCDKGEHAFSAKDPDRQHFAQTQTVPITTGNSYGRPTIQDRVEVTEEIDICGPHWKSGGILAEKAIPPPQTLDDLQKEKDDYDRGYQAAVDEIATGRRP